jgi:hypothetical protein
LDQWRFLGRVNPHREDETRSFAVTLYTMGTMLRR